MPVVINGTTGISGVDGSAGTPAFQGSDTNTGIRFGTDIVSLVTGGSDRLYIDSSGNIGIGTTSPGNFGAFVVRGYAALGGSYGNVSGHFSDGITGSLFIKHAAGEIGYFSDSSVALTFYSNSTERLRIDSSGRLLVGTTTTSAAPLTVNGTIEANGSFYRAVFGNGYVDGDSGVVSGGNSAEVQIQTVTSNRPAILSLGGAQGAYENLGAISFFNSGNTDGKRCRAQLVCGQEGGTANEQGGVFVFLTAQNTGTSPTEHLRLSSQGETRCFSNNNTSTIELRNGSSSGTANRLLYGLHSATNNTDGTAIYSIFTNGTVGTPSDIRLKKNVESTRDGYLNDITNLRVVKYHWKTQDDTEPKELGLIAQEVEEVFPGLIHTEGEGDSEIKEVKRSVIPFILLKALQEADAKIEAQQVVINNLLARVTSLESA